jgi:TetR/AcrR family transcriptional repressor of nem operon
LERGFAGASLCELEAATGLGRGSLYQAFGSKEGLFTKALQRFDARYERLPALLEKAGSVREGLEAVFDAWLPVVCPAEGPAGCMLQVAATEGSPMDSGEPEALIRRRSEATERMFRKALERGIERGELQATHSPAFLARVLMVSMQGIAASARMGRTRRELQGVRRFLLDAVLGPAAPR